MLGNLSCIAQIITECNVIYTLKYFLVMDYNKDKIYGAEIIMSIEGEDKEYERKRCFGLSNNIDTVNEFISLLAINTVTPTSLPYIVEDFFNI